MARRKVNLGTFDDRDVRGTTIKVTNAGDGLSQALAIEPELLHHGETIYVVLETKVAKVSFDPAAKDSDDLVRVHVLKAGTATIVDRALVAEVIEAQAEKIIAARDEETGAQQLDLKGNEGKREPGEGYESLDEWADADAKAKATGAAKKRTRRTPAKRS